MPNQSISVGGRNFQVFCQPGEESFLMAAVAMLDAEAHELSTQNARLPDSQMLLMAGLMLADRAAGHEDAVKVLEGRVARLEAEVKRLRDAPPPEPERVEVPVEVPVEIPVEIPVIPEKVLLAFAEIAERAEALAEEVESKSRASAS